MTQDVSPPPEKNHIGLTSAEAKEILNKTGPNLVSKPPSISFLSIIKEEITEPMILLLLTVGVFYSLWGKPGDAVTIFGVIIALTLTEVWNEYRAKKAISSLSVLAEPKTKVLRDGKIIEIETEKVVPKDVLILSPGAKIAADSKIFRSYSLEIDSSPLTGESFPEEKKDGSKAYAGTTVVSGEGKAEVFATGKNTKIGKISALAEEIKSPKTPLQIAMKSLSKSLLGIAVFFSVAIPLAGFLLGQDPRQMILTGLALAFAFIPEEMPIIITMVLGLGAYRLSRENFLVKKLKAAEVMGNATVILTDKTGTITENKMKIVSVFPKERETEIISCAISALTEISLSLRSNPTDKAIIDRAEELKISPSLLPIARERIFGDGGKTKSILRQIDSRFKIFTSGAPEEILALSRDNKELIKKELKKETDKGRRVIAVANKIIPSHDRDLPFKEMEKDLVFTGLISIEDSPRPGVKETVALARNAGIRTIIVTGDHPNTASFIAENIGIPGKQALTGKDLDELFNDELLSKIKEVSVFARISPEQKYRLVKTLRENKEIVAVTGDGINDTLALKAADIGIAMGIKGTDAAREASDAVLMDDNFTTIAKAIFEGRKFFDNLKKGVKYYLSVKVALILIFTLPLLMNIPFPFQPIQIIILELFMDLAASAGFVNEIAEKNIYKRPPRNPDEAFLNKKMLGDIIASALSLFAAVTISYLYTRSLNLSIAETQTFAFTAWLISHILLAFVSRSETEPLLKQGIFSNKIMIIWALAVFLFLIIAMSVPIIGFYFRIAPLPAGQIILIGAICFISVFWLEIKKYIQ